LGGENLIFRHRK